MSIELLRPVNAASNESAPKSAKTAVAVGPTSGQPSFGQLLAARQNDGDTAHKNRPLSAQQGAVSLTADPDIETPSADTTTDADTETRQDGALPAGLVWREMTALRGAPSDSTASVPNGPGHARASAAGDKHVSATAAGGAALAPAADTANPRVGPDIAIAQHVGANARVSQRRPGLNTPAERTIDLRSERDGTRQLPADAGTARALHANAADDGSPGDKHVSATAAGGAALAPATDTANPRVGPDIAIAQRVGANARVSQRRPGLNTPAERTIDLRSERDSTRQLPADAGTARALHANAANDGAAAQNATRVAAAFGERLAERMSAADNGSRSHANDAAPLTVGVSAQAQAGQAMPAAPAAPAMPNAAALTAPLGSQAWDQALNQQALRLSHFGDGSAKLTLHPRDLGQLHVSLKMGEQAQLHFASAHADVRAAVEAALPQLRHAFADNGINLSQTTVSDQSAGQGQNQDSSGSNSSARGSQPGAGQDQGTAMDTGESLSAPIAITSLAGRTLDGGIDIFA